MKNKKFMALALMGITSSVCLFANDVVAWERSAADKCEKEMNKKADKCSKESDKCQKDADKQADKCQKDSDKCMNQAQSQADKDKCSKDADKCKKDANKQSDKCSKEADKCKKDVDQCKKDMGQKDQDSFSSALSQKSSRQFETFTPDQKKKAMDLADGNKMAPDDAVAKVAGNQ